MWREDGWTPMEALHEDLLDYESMRSALGDAAMDGACGPTIDWPEGWDAESLVSHRAVVASHFSACRTDALRRAREGA